MIQTSSSMAVVVVTKEIDAETEECLESATRQTRTPDELIVVSGCISEEVRTRWPQVRFLERRANRSEARNLGWRATVSPLVCFWEADAVFSEGWLEEVAKAFEQGADAVIDRRRVYRPESYFQRTLDAQFEIRYADYTPFSAWAFRRDVLAALDGFDDRLEYAEDTDLGIRLKEQGYRIVLAEKAVQMHRGEPKNFSSMLRRRFTFGYRKANGFYRKHRDLLPKTKCAMTVLGTIFIAAILLRGQVSLAIFIFLAVMAAALARAVIGARSKVSLRYAPGLAVVWLAGGFCYHLGVSVGSLQGHLDRNRPPSKEAKGTLMTT